MTDRSRAKESSFDGFAADYEAALAHGLCLSGEDKDYFARGRIMWLKECLGRLETSPSTALDFGCGTGSSVPLLANLLDVKHVTGLDSSPRSLEIARKHSTSRSLRFLLLDEYTPDGTLDLAFCNGVFHHIPPPQRADAVDYIHRALRPGGLFAFWENNPWNPGTRLVMKRIPFDRDAVTLTSSEAGDLLRDRGFEILRTDFLFIFPRVLRWLRGVEQFVTRWPLGAQYQILCRK